MRWRYVNSTREHRRRGLDNGLSVASFVLGLLWLSWIGSILAVIFGHVALKQIRERNQSGRGLAIACLVFGWIGVGVLILFLFAILLPNLLSA
jgi:hypothetical protein